MNQTVDRPVEEVLNRASYMAVWLPWYFKRGAFTLLTIPLFLFLVNSVIISTFAAFVQGLALIKVTYAVLGLLAAVLIVVTGWILLVSLPPVLYFSLLKHIPGLWLRPDASTRTRLITSATVLVLLPVSSSSRLGTAGSSVGLQASIHARLSTLV
jgi:hypothetical protein